MTGSARKSTLVHAPLLVLIVACQLAFSHAGVPVVIWCPQNESSDYDSTFKTARSNPLLKLSSEEFEKSLSQLGVTEPAIVVADELCVEDLKNNKILSIATNGSKLHYFPYVLTADAIFQKMYSNKQIRMIEDINDDHELNMILKDADSSDCIALTGKQCRYSQAERIKRDTPTNTTEFKIRTDRVLLYSADTPLFKNGNLDKAVPLPVTQVADASTRIENNTLILTIRFTNIDNIGALTLEFFFPIQTTGYYTLKKVGYELSGTSDTLLPNRDIYIPFNFSYHCTPQTVFIMNNTVSLNISEMQIQVDHPNGTFTDAYDCVGFTSIPIWTGIFVTAILALIMIWALTMIMDIRTMDRFDDPKGKTITISAME